MSQLPQFYEEYQRLGGELQTFEEYKTILNIFLKHTQDIYLYNITTLHKSKIKALEAVIEEAKISWAELDRIHGSVKRAAGYGY